MALAEWTRTELYRPISRHAATMDASLYISQKRSALCATGLRTIFAEIHLSNIANLRLFYCATRFTGSTVVNSTVQETHAFSTGHEHLWRTRVGQPPPGPAGLWTLLRRALLLQAKVQHLKLMGSSSTCIVNWEHSSEVKLPLMGCRIGSALLSLNAHNNFKQKCCRMYKSGQYQWIKN